MHLDISQVFFRSTEHENPHRKGSTGCGIVLNGGVTTEVKVGESVEKTEIFLNGKEVEGRTTRTVAEMITDVPVRIKSWAEIPIGCGFGASGAGALGTAYALNKALSLNQTTKSLAEYAHVAEVINCSGLGDIAGQSNGGVVIRIQPGGSEFGLVDGIPVPESRVYCIVLGEISTNSVLKDRLQLRELILQEKPQCQSCLKNLLLKILCTKQRSLLVKPAL